MSDEEMKEERFSLFNTQIFSFTDKQESTYQIIKLRFNEKY